MYDTGTPTLDMSRGKAGQLWYHWDKKYFDLGASLVSPSLRFYPQASLMHYAAEHYTAGGVGRIELQAPQLDDDRRLHRELEPGASRSRARHAAPYEGEPHRVTRRGGAGGGQKGRAVALPC